MAGDPSVGGHAAREDRNGLGRPAVVGQQPKVEGRDRLAPRGAAVKPQDASVLMLPPWSVSVAVPSAHSVPDSPARIVFRTLAVPPSSEMAGPVPRVNERRVHDREAGRGVDRPTPGPSLPEKVEFVTVTLPASIAPPSPLVAVLSTNVLPTTVSGALPVATAPPDPAWLPARVEFAIETAPPSRASIAPPASVELPF